MKTENTTAQHKAPALLMLEDGTCFEGVSCGATGEVFGEVCFNTAVVGYLEIISDPSYTGQILVMTYPQIGNYGVARADLQSEKLGLRGLVAHDINETPSNFRSEMSLPEFLATEGVVAISQVDTRALTQHIRDNGSLRAVISTSDLDRASLLKKVQASTPLSEQNVTQEVSCKRAFEYLDKNEAYDFILKPAAPAQHKVVVYDCGVTASLLRNVQRAGCAVTVAPWNTPAQDILTVKPDGVIFSNGPGNPEQAQETIAAAAELLGKIPVLGVGFGMQIMALAAGAEIERLKFGHHGCNIPVKNLTTGSTEITTQHHNFGVVFASLGTALAQEGADAKAALDNASGNALDNDAPVVKNERFGPIALTHTNLNDQTPEGISFLDIPAFGVQHHPDEASGSDESHYVFTDFIKLMDAKN